MKTTAKGKIVGFLLVLTLCLIPPVHADFGTGANSAEAHLDFVVRIPQFIYFRVGQLVAVDEVLFDVPNTNVGDGTPVAGDISVVVTLISNAGPLEITPTNDGVGLGLRGAVIATNRIDYSTITSTSDNPDLLSPALSNAGGTPTTPAETGGITSETATWSFEYDNSVVMPADDYIGRVTYTAARP